jgi:hypothetical protein
MTEPRKPHPIESLPFVFDHAPKSRGNVKRSFWHVEPTGRYGEDCKTGTGFALELLRYQRKEDTGSSHLAAIVRHMPRDLSGIEVGFLETIGYAAQFGLLQAERQVAYWKRSEMYETHGALVNQRPDGSVVIEQPDGTRAVYRKEGAS